MPKARKKSTDPIQEALRSHKSEWNEVTKEFIAHLIAFKRGVNGKGDAKVGLPPSNIKDPLPGEISSLLGNLTSQFQTLVGGANSIISEQAQYAKNRRKKQEKPKGNPAPAMPPTPTDNTAQVDAMLANVASSEVGMEVYSSSRPSRMWEYVKSPFKRDPSSRQRIGLLSLAADIYYDFLDLENAVLSLDMDSIPNAVSKYQMTIYNINAFKKSFKDGVKEKPTATLPPGAAELKEEQKQEQKQEESIADPGQGGSAESARIREMEGDASPPSSGIPNSQVLLGILMKIKADLQVIMTSSLPLKKEVNSIMSLITKLRSTKDKNKAYDVYRRIERQYEELLMIVEATLHQEPNEGKREELKKTIVATELSSDAIVKLSHNYITRLLKKYWVGLRSSNKTSVHRINISRSIGIIKKLFQEMMDSLEDNLNLVFLKEKLMLVEVEMQKIHHSLSILNVMYRQKFYEDYNSSHKNKGQSGNNALMDRVWQDEIRRDFRNEIF